MDFFEHGGRNGGTNISYDFSANINPLGMPDAAAQVLQREWKRAESYPEETSRTLCEAIARQWQADEAQLVCTNGASELIYAAVRALKPAAGLILAPAFFRIRKSAPCGRLSCEVFPFTSGKRLSGRRGPAYVPGTAALRKPAVSVQSQ